MNKGTFRVPAVRLVLLAAAALVPACGGGGGGGGGAPAGPSNVTVLISAAADGTPANGTCDQPSISDSGQFVAFRASGATTNLLGAGSDTDGFTDIYLKNTSTGAVTRLSVGSGGPVNGHSSEPAISGDGNFIAFTSAATNLVAAFTTYTAATTNVFLYDRLGSSLSLLTPQDASATTAGNGSSSAPRISGDGSFIAFQSAAVNLLPAGTTYAAGLSVFRKTRTGGTVLVSHSVVANTTGNGNSSAPDISSTGQHVVFSSLASNLSAADVDATSDVFVRDVTGSTTTLVSVTGASPGTKGDAATFEAAISGDGAHVAFKSTANNFDATDPIDNDIYLRRNWANALSAATEKVSVHSTLAGNSGNSCSSPDLGTDGRFVAFSSMSQELTSGDVTGFRDIFLRDSTVALTTTLISVSSAGVAGDGNSGTVGVRPGITASGSYVVFESAAANFAAGTTGTQVYRRGPF